MIKTDTSPAPMSGEERLKRKTRRLWTIIAVLFVVGFIGGFATARAEDIMGFEFGGPWPREIALGLLALFLVAMGIGTPLMHREMDDYSKDIHRRAASFAAGAIFIGYPAWFLLWKASLLPEPVHWGPFVAGYVAFYLALLFYRYR